MFKSVNIKKLIKEELNQRFKQLIKNRLKRELPEPIDDFGDLSFENENNWFFSLKKSGVIRCEYKWTENYMDRYNLTFQQFKEILHEYINDNRLDQSKSI